MARGKRQIPSAKKRSHQALVDPLEGRLLLSAARHHFHTWTKAPTPPPSANTGVILLARSAASGKQTKKSASPSTSGGPVGFIPSQLRHAYGFDAVTFNNGTITGDGSGQTIAIIDNYYVSTISSDLHQFDLQFGLPDPVFNVVDQTGAAITVSNHPSFAPIGSAWALETALDVEWAHAMAPGAKILLVETDSASFDDLLTNGAATAASTAGVSVVTMSFGGTEFNGENVYDSSLLHNNVTFIASTGDGGAPAEFPSTSPSVVAVGGTTLTLDINNNYASESAWSLSGGSPSTMYSKPAYQSSIVPGGGQRAAPDVAFDADPGTGVAVYDSYDNPSLPWAKVGGTSLAAPMFAGLVAVANQGRAAASMPALSGASQTLPLLYGAPTSDFHDITTGSNGYAAAAGYDLVTGLGTPIANKLIPYLSSAQAPTGITLPDTNNTVTVSRNGDNIHADINVNGTIQQLMLSQSTPFTFTGGANDDTFIFDFSKGDPLPAGGASINGGSGANIVTFIGTTGNDTATVGLNVASFSGGTAALPGGTFSNVPLSILNVQAVNLPGGSGGNDNLLFTAGSHITTADTPTTSGAPNVTVKVTSGANANFSGDQHLAALILDNGSAALPFFPTTLTIAGALQIINNGLLNIQTGQIYLNTAATASAVVVGYLTSGYNHGGWNGFTGIVSTYAAASPGTMSVGYALAGQGAVPPIPAGQMLVKYTPVGDADLSGTADFNDFLVLQNNLGNAGGWAQGDFDYNGIVDYNDFTLLNNFL